MKIARQGRILEMCRSGLIRSQEEMSSLLEKEGIRVTQATLSRDIRELGLVKVRGSYQISGEVISSPPDEVLRRAFAQYVLRTGVSDNIVMIKTSPGNAHSVAVVVDAAQWSEVLGTIAGDDTVFILLRKSSMGKKLLERIQELSE
ncbi:MAG TPA: arginine repressor [Acidobacteriota bacterium]|nr:arginine repressor [Acidobacteriota bacterium]